MTNEKVFRERIKELRSLENASQDTHIRRYEIYDELDHMERYITGVSFKDLSLGETLPQYNYSIGGMQ